LLIDTERMTVASLLKRKGYAAGCIGKWHLGIGDTPPDWTYGKLKPGPLEIGFDYYFGVPTSNNWPPFVYVENHRVSSHPEYDVWVPNHRRNEDIAKTLTARAVKYIEQNKDQPFFLYFPTCNIHSPITPHKQFHGSSDCGARGDFIAELDWSVGEILKTLDRLNLTNNTLLVFSSDNGGTPTDEKYGHKSNGDWRGQKAQIYEAGHRVPFIASWPGQIKPGSSSEELICLTDFMAMCGSIVGSELPSGAAEDSYNIMPVLRGEELAHPIREALVHHSVDGTFAIRQGDWKLILGTGDGGWPPDKPPVKIKPGEAAGQLYNLSLDPSEKSNLYLKHQEIVDRLTKLLEKYKKQGHSRPF
jgi:arylsulfatase A-like enzyme